MLEQIRNADNLPTLPTVAVEVLRMTQADDLSVADIAKVIQQDPALTSKILRVVNSSMFGMSRKISSLQQAMVVLGLRTVKVMVLSFSLVDAMQSKQKLGFDHAMYWRRSLTTAVIARLLAERIQRSLADEAFVGGLLCDISMLAAVTCAPDLYAAAIEHYTNNEGLTVQEAEQETLGLTHEEITHALLDHWGLPDELCEAARTHHQSVDAPAPEAASLAMLTRMLRAASRLADIFVADQDAGQLEPVQQEILASLPIKTPALEELLGEIDKNVKETASLFSIDIGQTLGYHQIQAQAATQLVQLSMAAELERAQTAQREQEAQARVQELDSQNRELTAKATTDGLTGVANRAALQEKLVAACQEAQANQTPLGAILLDLDRFKKLNDTFGHQTGDEALRQVGAVLAQVATDNQFPGRYGGEEFMLVVTNVTARELRALAEDIRLSIAKLRVPHGGRNIPITASLGVSHMNPSDPGLNPTELVERADRCLYDAKNNGRNRVVCIDSRQAATVAARQEAGV